MEQPASQSAAVEPHLPLVAAIARAMGRRLPPTVEVDDLINDGVLGLMEALQRYDPQRRVVFATYAGHRIRGAILDGLRRRDPLPRAYRRIQKTEPNRRVQFLALEEVLMVPDGEESNPEAVAVEADLKRQIWLGLAALPPRDRQVLVLRMVRGLLLREVAAHLSLSITRVVEIQTRGLAHMRRFLVGEPLPRARRVASAPGEGGRQEAAASTPNDTTASAPIYPPPPPVTVGAG
ncbi:MAG: sigma-70 family RNA polymerase sigma factor [bacterium]|nr:sigma-70 family RNA polymerase sigma factor [bacterium]